MDTITGLTGSISIDRKRQTAKLTIRAKGKKRGKALWAFMDAYGKDGVKSKLSVYCNHRGFSIESAKIIIELAVMPEGLNCAELENEALRIEDQTDGGQGKLV